MVRLFTNSAIIPAAGPLYVGPGNEVSGATAWWGLRAYSAAAIGTNCIRLREDGGNTEQDFPSISGGGLNLSAIASFKGANNLFITTLYDQSGNGNDLTQTTAANQPGLALATLGSLPVMQFSHASDQFIRAVTFPSVPQPHTYSIVFNQTFNATDSRLVSTNNGTASLILNDSQGSATDTFTLYSGGVSSAVTCLDATWHALHIVWNSSTTTANVDGTTTSGLNPGTTGINNNFNLGAIPSLGNNGLLVEFGLWPSALSAGDQTALDSNQHTYWCF